MEADDLALAKEALADLDTQAEQLAAAAKAFNSSIDTTAFKEALAAHQATMALLARTVHALPDYQQLLEQQMPVKTDSGYLKIERTLQKIGLQMQRAAKRQ